MNGYDPHDWTSHLFDIQGSMVKEIIGRVSVCVIWSATIVWIHESFPNRWFDLEMPETAHALVGTALGLLLVFRTNASYDRFWEGRKMWGGMVNETRNLTRQVSVLCQRDVVLTRRLIGWTIAFVYASMHRLRGGEGVGSIAASLPADQVARVTAADHPPLAVARQISANLDAARQQGLIDTYQQMQLDQNVQLLIDYHGACERIRSTPLPYAYAVHLRRALIIYCFTLPMALVAKFGWDTIAAVFVITYIFFGIEEIGVEIEDPFGTDANDLPLERLCETIEGNLRAVAADVATEPQEPRTK
jgi:putative membrane protein